MAEENHLSSSTVVEEQIQESPALNSDSTPIDTDESTQPMDMNNRLKTDLMNYCLSFLKDDEEARVYVKRVWKKYLRCVGDVAMVRDQPWII